jgi:hypothetical protein
MGQKLGQDSNLLISKVNSSRLKLSQLDEFNKNIRITIGGQQYKIYKDLICNLNNNGLGGLDTGLLQGNYTVYYLYAVIKDNVISLIASKNQKQIGPEGFKQAYKYITEFKTKQSAEIDIIGE